MKTYFNWIVFSLILISMGFIFWSGLFIHKSSFITIDEQRSYSLFDDAMISMRYAWNFSHGYGLVWNSGEYVQGYTNLLMVLIMSLFTLILSKTNAVLAVQILGVIFILTIAFLNMRIASIIFPKDNFRSTDFFALSAFFCGLLYYPLIYWSLMGMETGLLTMLLLAGVFFALRYLQSKKSMFLVFFSVAGGCAFLTRNDSIIFFFILCFFIFFAGFKEWGFQNIFYELLISLGIYFVFIVGDLAFQYFYYGEMLPNTYILKMTGMPLLIRVQNGIGFFAPFLNESFVVIILAILALFFGFSKEKMLIVSLFLAIVMYQIYVGGDPWNYWRIMAPAMPLLLLLCIDAAFFIGERIGSVLSSRYSFLKYGVALALISLCLIVINIRFWPEISLQMRPYDTSKNRRNVNIAIALNDLLEENATIGVFWAGAIPYYVDNAAIDFLGKSDRYIANLTPDLSGSVAFNGMTSVPGHNKYNLTYSIAKLKPTYVQKFFWGNQDVYSMVSDDYVKVNYKHLTLYLLKDSPDVNWEKLDIP